MYLILKTLHSTTAYIAFLLLLAAIIYSYIGLIRKSPFSKKSRMIALAGLASAHLQTVFGFFLYFFSPLGSSSLSATAMKSPELRFYAIEHPMVMLLAIVLITVGYSRAKREKTDLGQYRNIAILYTLGFLLILTRLPWSVWLL